MWTKIARIILRYRIWLLSALIVITAILGYIGRTVEPTFKFAELVPRSDPKQQEFIAFKKTFGEDANSFAVGFEGADIFQLDGFHDFKKLIEDINTIDGLDTVVGIPNLVCLQVNKTKKKFDLVHIFPEEIQDQSELDSLLNFTRTLKIYEDQLFNKNFTSTILLINISQTVINSPKRQTIVSEIQTKTNNFLLKYPKTKAHYAGIPYVRSILTGKVQEELKLFLYLSMAITALVLIIFFRSISSIVIPVLVVGAAVLWTMGTLVLFGYKITMLTGLIPPIIVITGVPNCVYLLTKYHQEFRRKRSKVRALESVISKIGIVTLITNATTAIGFLVLITAEITILKEFGIVAGINVISTFLLSVIIMPIILLYFPAPTERQMKHLDGKALNKLLDAVARWVDTKRSVIFGVTGVVVVLSIIGMTRLYSVSYMVDDIPKNDPVKKDLDFFEKTYAGVMPLEIVLNTHDKNSFKDRDIMLKINEFEKFIALQPELTKPISYLSFIKAANQAYYGNDSSFYQVPSSTDRSKILLYLARSNKGKSATNALEKFVDSTGQIRLSIKVADIGSNKMDSLLNFVVVPKAKEIFEGNETKVEVKSTGTTLLFIQGINYLITNLKQSLVLAIVLIALIMALLFRSRQMVLLSLITNIIPQIATAAMMGYLDIPLKPSTALIFSIAFGISVDDSIHYLAKFRQELFLNNFDIRTSVMKSIRETGASMIYTSIILFFGFIIFAGSNFIGTRMLGILTSTTLLMAMVTNLVLLPTLILTFDSGKRKGRLTKRLIDKYNEKDLED